jgi:type IV fimbrial biogenesis protein FimT
MNNRIKIPACPRASGFTLIELMVTVSVAALLLGLAAPSFHDLAIRNELSTYTNELIAGINYARSEAVRTGKSIVICPTSDEGESCSGSWSDGWITFTDLDENGELDSDNEAVLKTRAPLSTGFWIDDGGTFDGGLTYTPDGRTDITGTFVICNKGKLKGAHAVVIAPMRPRVARDTDDDGIPNDDTNNNITACEQPS